MPINDIYMEVKLNDDNKKRFVDLYDIDPDAPVDPLQKVVPTTDQDFFGTFALNLLVFTKLYFNDENSWDDQYSVSKDRLIATYDKFAKYGLYIFIDGAADDIQNADPDQLVTFQEMLSDMANELSSYGVVFGGLIEDESTLTTTITQTITSFFEDTTNYKFQ